MHQCGFPGSVLHGSFKGVQRVESELGSRFGARGWRGGVLGCKSSLEAQRGMVYVGKRVWY